MRHVIKSSDGVTSGFQFVGSTFEMAALARQQLDVLAGLTAANPTHYGDIWNNVLRAAATSSLMLAELLVSAEFSEKLQAECRKVLADWRIRLLLERDNHMARRGLPPEAAGRSLLPTITYFEYNWDRLLGPVTTPDPASA